MIDHPQWLYLESVRRWFTCVGTWLCWTKETNSIRWCWVGLKLRKCWGCARQG